MKCPKCNAKISELDEICPNCKTKLDDYDEKLQKQDYEKEPSKTTLLNIIYILQISGFIIFAFYTWGSKTGNILQGIIYIVIGVVLFAFIRGFSDIIDLLDEINDKLN